VRNGIASRGADCRFVTGAMDWLTRSVKLRGYNLN
jgi:hypothetical protein